MNGAREYALMFSTGQYGRLYLVSGHHARGRVFHIYVLPKDEEARPNGNNGPLNKNAVEVYGITGGQPGWTETYGWLHVGKWQEDFEALVAERRAKIAAHTADQERKKQEAEEQERARRAELLASYQ